MTLQEIFAGCTAKPLLAEEPMAKHTSFRIGGPADLMAMPQSEQELQQLLQRAGEAKVPVTLIGNGSNLLVRDKGIRGLVIKLGNMLNDIAVDGCMLTFGSGVSLAAASRKAAELGLSGMEFAVGIPGSIGGAVYMNAGAYDGEMAKVVTGVRVMELDGTISELPAAALDFGYRHTALQGSGKIVTAVTVRLTAGDKQAIADKWQISVTAVSLSSRWSCPVQAVCSSVLPDISPVHLSTRQVLKATLSAVRRFPKSTPVLW